MIVDLQYTETLAQADEFRENGNEYFKAGRYQEALAQYNKSLVIARHDKERTALCYGNRSAAFLGLKYFKHCLHNIELAEPDYPLENIQRLHDRRQKCTNLMKNNKDQSMEPFQHNFKLSYDANPKIPYFIDALQLKSGRHLITNRELKAGDVVGVIDGVWICPVNDLTTDHLQSCYTCHNANNGDLMPGMCRALFCSDSCRIEHEQNEPDHEFLHEIEKLHAMEQGYDTAEKPSSDYLTIHRVFMKIYDAFGSVDEMRNFIKSHGKFNYHFCDFDWSLGVEDLQYHKNMLLLIMSNANFTPVNMEFILQTRVDEFRKNINFLAKMEIVGRITEIFKDTNVKNQQFIDKLVRQICTHCCIKFMLSKEHNFVHSLAIFSHPAMSCIKRDCDPNIIVHIENRKKIVWTINRPVPAGSALTYAIKSLGYFQPGWQGCMSTEKCYSCTHKWSKQIIVEKIVVDCEKFNQIYYKSNDPKKLQNLLNRKTDICKFITQNYKGYSNNPKVRPQIALGIHALQQVLYRISDPVPGFKALEVPKPPKDDEESDSDDDDGTAGCPMM